jgi:hypothetical protein
VGRLWPHPRAAGLSRCAYAPHTHQITYCRRQICPLPANSHARTSADPSPTHHNVSQPPPSGLASAFAAEHLAPHAARWDRESCFPVDAFRRAAELGFGGLYTPEELGGAGLSRADGAVIFEALAYGDGGSTTLGPVYMEVIKVQTLESQPFDLTT